ncbi:uncharacterized protein LOC131156028 [Malania oleifera]|uniref:uncharacterized protein LOC131156028 n=1 Tax=Malania oleifera TaxID=397392 RepID=UPI0025AE0603|nr:uncharacterized protein LOC131156028 [Malania oleifera]
MDSGDENIEVEGREGSDTSSKEDVDTSKVLQGIVRQVKAEMKKEPKEQNCPPVGQDCSIKEFMRMNPPTFVGGADLVAADNWITIAEYAAKSVELSRFTPFLIPNEARKAKKFRKGLRHRIYELVVGFQVHTFSKLVDKASVLEKSIQSSTEPSEQKKRPPPSSFQAEVSQGSRKKRKEIVDFVCQKCNKRHRGEC